MRNFVIPELGENINSATVVKVLVKAGDVVEADQPLLELETDKATIEVPADAAGTVAEIKVNEGEQVSIGQIVLVFAGESAATPEPAKEEAPAPAQPLATPQPTSAPLATAGTGTLEFTLPELGENIRTATIVKVLIAVGDTVENDQPVLEVETDKATIEVPSSIAGKVTEVLVAEGNATPIGAVIFRVSGNVTAPAAAPAAQSVAVQTVAPVVVEAKTEFVPEATKPAEAPKVIAVENQPPILQNAAPAAPSVRRLAREIGVDVNQVKGSGPGGRILLDDVKAYSKLLHQQRNEVQHIRAEQHQQPLPDFTKFGEVERQAMSNIRFKTAEHLSHAWHTIPHVTQFDKADITALEEFRKSYAKTAEKEGVNLP